MLSFFFAILITPSYALQDHGKDYHAVADAVIKKEKATGISIDISNGTLITLTDSLRHITTDTLMHFDDATRQGFIGQLENATLTRWDEKQIYHAQVVERDLVREITASAVDGKIAAAFQPVKDKTLRIHRISQPLFFGSGALVGVEFERLIMLNNAIVMRDGYRRIYFLSPGKKPGRWKVTNYVTVNTP